MRQARNEWHPTGEIFFFAVLILLFLTLTTVFFLRVVNYEGCGSDAIAVD